MDLHSPVPPVLSAGVLLVTTAEQLRARRDDLEPLVLEYDRIDEIAEAFGILPNMSEDAGEEGSPRREHAELVRQLGRMNRELSEWSARLAPLVDEYERIIHILPAFEPADGVSSVARSGRRRARAGRTARRSTGMSPSGAGRLDELRGLLDQPRARSELAERMALSPSRVTELLERLVRGGEVVEIRDPDRATRKLWSLTAAVAVPGDRDETDSAHGDEPAESDLSSS